jgi:hypothetical protein
MPHAEFHLERKCFNNSRDFFQLANTIIALADECGEKLVCELSFVHPHFTLDWIYLYFKLK